MNIKISDLSAKGAKLIDRDKWTELDNKIFEATEEFCECISHMGCELVAIGELDDMKHVISRCIFTINQHEGEGCLSCEDNDGP